MRILELMQERGILPIQLAVHMNVSPTAVTNWIRGYKYPSADKLPKIAAFLGCSIDELYGTEEPHSTTPHQNDTAREESTPCCSPSRISTNTPV